MPEVTAEPYEEEEGWDGEVEETEAAPKKRGTKPLVLAPLAAAFEKAQRKHAKAAESHEALTERVADIEEKIAEKNAAHEEAIGRLNERLEKAQAARDAADPVTLKAELDAAEAALNEALGN